MNTPPEESSTRRALSKAPDAKPLSPRLRVPAFVLALASALLALRPLFPETRPGAEKLFNLASFLKSAADDCRRLESAVLDFTCRETIEEKTDLTRDVEESSAAAPDWSKAPGGRLAPGATILSRSTARSRRSLVFVYQCVRDLKGAIRETRTLLEENGRSGRVPEAKPGAANFDYGRALLAPVALFAGRFQADYDYAAAGSERFAGRTAVIVQATPKAGASVAPNISGRAWIDPATGAMMKIEWDESRVGRQRIFRERGDKYKMIPLITVAAEFGIEKSGLRFPTKLFYEEAYLNARGRKFIRAETAAAYAGFEFFTVEVEVK